jgi:hypothetical protein
MMPCARHQAHSGAIPEADGIIPGACGGFATSAGGNPLAWDEQRRKLELVVKTARRVWGAKALSDGMM